MAKKAKTPEMESSEETATPPARNGRRKMLVVGLAAALMVGGAAGGWAYIGRSPAKSDSTEAAKKPVTVVNIREMTVNLAGEPNQDRSRFLKFSVALEVEDPKVAAEIQPLLPRVEDAFQVLVRQLRPTDLEGSAGVYRLREELLRRVNLAVHPARVEAVLFKDLVVQ